MVIMIIALAPGAWAVLPIMRYLAHEGDGNCNINTINAAQTSEPGNTIITPGQKMLDTTQPCNTSGTRDRGFLLPNLLANISSVRLCRLSMAGYLLYLNNCGPGV